MPNELGSFIAAEVSRAEVDFQTNRARSLSIVGVTGGIVGLVSGLLAIAAGSRRDILPKGGFVVLAVALLAFVAAAVFALCVNLPATVTAADMKAVKRFVESKWDADDWDKQVADLYVDYVASLRTVNSRSAKFINASIVCEIAGIVCISVMTFIIVWHLRQ
jgi:magnesium-transporting ATPase (P-type)